MRSAIIIVTYIMTTYNDTTSKINIIYNIIEDGKQIINLRVADFLC